MFINPFKKHDVSEFPGVLVPLDEDTHRASMSVPVPVHDESDKEKPKSEDGHPSRPPSDAGSGIVNHGMTKEKLKQEIIADVAAADQDTPYDRTSTVLLETLLNINTTVGKSKVINKALQDMGMGRYQWELFALCGGGWMAGKKASTIKASETTADNQ